MPNPTDDTIAHYVRRCGCGFVLDLLTGAVHKVVIACPCVTPSATATAEEQ